MEKYRLFLAKKKRSFSEKKRSFSEKKRSFSEKKRSFSEKKRSFFINHRKVGIFTKKVPVFYTCHQWQCRSRGRHAAERSPRASAPGATTLRCAHTRSHASEPEGEREGWDASPRALVFEMSNGTTPDTL